MNLLGSSIRLLAGASFAVLNGQVAYAFAPLTSASHAKQYHCSTESHPSVVLHISESGSAFDVIASSGNTVIFQRLGLRPSLNVRVADESSSAINEFVDFNERGLEVIPVDGKSKLEIDLGASSTKVHYQEADLSMKLLCAIESSSLISFLKISPHEQVMMSQVKAVAFDIDDTLMFTSPTFARGFATGGTPKADDVVFWTHTNECDKGCAEATITLSNGQVKVLPANLQSTPKEKALELIRYHKALGHEVFAITARPDINGDSLRDYLEAQMGIARKNIFFEPDIEQAGNIAGKTDRIEALNLDVFYGDSDSDITDAQKAFVDASGKPSKRVQPVRFLRSPKSSNRKAGELNKYHPGYFGEPILADSY